MERSPLTGLFSQFVIWVGGFGLLTGCIANWTFIPITILSLYLILCTFNSIDQTVSSATIRKNTKPGKRPKQRSTKQRRY